MCFFEDCLELGTSPPPVPSPPPAIAPVQAPIREASERIGAAISAALDGKPPAEGVPLRGGVGVPSRSVVPRAWRKPLPGPAYFPPTDLKIGMFASLAT